MSKQDGGPAFPIIGEGTAKPRRSGMTLRQWYAGQALAGLVGTRPDENRHVIARLALRQADAMIKVEQEDEG